MMLNYLQISKMNKSILVLAMLVFCSKSYAGLISNGNFDTCNFNGWQTETDLLQNGQSPDFLIGGKPSNCHAIVSVEQDGSYASQNNRLFQKFKNINNVKTIQFDYWLTTDFINIVGQNSLNSADKFWIAITDGFNRYDARGNISSFLIAPTSITTAQKLTSYSTDITNRFDTAIDWYLEFFISIGTNDIGQPDDMQSSLFIDNVKLTPTHTVNEPTSYALMLFGLLLLCHGRFRK